MRNEKPEQLRERLLSDDEARAVISLRAYDIYQRRGGAPGHEIEDWVQAEKEILDALIKEEPQFGDESSTVRVLSADATSKAGDKKSGKTPAASNDKQLSSSSGKTAKSQARPPKAKQTKSRKSTKSTARRKPIVNAEQPPTVKERTADKTPRLIKRKSTAGERNKQT